MPVPQLELYRAMRQPGAYDSSHDNIGATVMGRSIRHHCTVKAWRSNIGLGSLVVVLVGGAILVGTVGAPDTVTFELRKYIIQFLLIVALGAVVAFRVDVAKRRAESLDEEQRKERDAADRERQFATDTGASLLDELDAAYRAVKRRRRSLRLVSLSDLTKENYLNEMWKLSEDKEDVEKLFLDIKAIKPWLLDLSPAECRVKHMEDYLNTLETEWEGEAPKPADQFQANELPCLKAFRAKGTSRESNFQGFRNDYRKARSVLVKLIAKRRTDVVPPASDRNGRKEADERVRPGRGRSS